MGCTCDVNSSPTYKNEPIKIYEDTHITSFAASLVAEQLTLVDSVSILIKIDALEFGFQVGRTDFIRKLFYSVWEEGPLSLTQFWHKFVANKAGKMARVICLEINFPFHEVGASKHKHPKIMKHEKNCLSRCTKMPLLPLRHPVLAMWDVFQPHPQDPLPHLRGCGKQVDVLLTLAEVFVF